MNGSSRRRIVVTRVLAVPLIISQLLTVHSWSEYGMFDLSLEVVGCILLGIAATGRVWSSIFIAGRKTHDLVIIGPYSVVRNPLYVFSFIGALGVAFCSENILVFAAVVIFFGVYYPRVVRLEERELLKLHAGRFSAYCERVPRFLPNFSLYHCPRLYEVDTRRVSAALSDSAVFLCAYPLFEVIEYLQQIGVLPVLAHLPT